MTWHYETTIAEVVHRLRDDTGESVWGVVNDGFDAGSVAALGTAEVLLPTGEVPVLLVEPLPGGFVLDVVRAFHGLTESEIHTLVRGLADELARVDDPSTRLGLACLGLDEEGRPRIIPGVRHPLETSVRRAVGELIYHAAHGSPWSESLLPVDVALASCSSQLRSLVTGLFDDVPPPRTGADIALTAVLAEVVPQLGLLPAPTPLPLVPAAKDLDPAQAITARLRATPAQSNPGPGSTAPDRTAAGAASRAAAGGGADTASGPAALRAAAVKNSPWKRRNRSGARSRTGARDARPNRGRPGRGTRGRRGAGAPTAAWSRVTALVRDRFHARTLTKVGIAAAMVVVLIGGLLITRAWSDSQAPPAEPIAGTRTDEGASSDAEDGRPSTAAPSPSSAEALSDADVGDRLGELCAARARALGSGDAKGLAALTVPGSSAALADELIDLTAFAGGTYAITVEDVQVRERSASTVTAAARMSTSATTDGKKKSFEAREVIFTLTLDSGAWKIAEVAEA